MDAEKNKNATALKKRDPKYVNTDISAVKALVQAAVNVELFTIPLYMTTLYSIKGMHEINSNNELYLGYRWPGSAPVAKPITENEKAFNTIYSVFIDEMLHLQLAANIASSVGVAPTFTSKELQNENAGWICYGDDKTTIPHILDLRDTKHYSHVKVRLGAVDENQLDLFLAIEEPSDVAEEELGTDKHFKNCQIKYELCRDKYFPSVPFKGWQEDYNESNLPLFGSIGYMYKCLTQYLEIRYSDNTTLWEALYQPVSMQRDQFNAVDSGHPYEEYPKFDATVKNKTKDSAKHTAEVAKKKVFTMINAITDQGEGSTVAPSLDFLTTTAKNIVERLIRKAQTNGHLKEKLEEILAFINNEPNAKHPKAEGEDTNLLDIKNIRALVFSHLEKEQNKSDRDLMLALKTIPLEDHLLKIQHLRSVKVRYRPDKLALEKDYPNYSAKGQLEYNHSNIAAARADNGMNDHYERFIEVKSKLGQIVTWEKWHTDPEHHWTADDLKTEYYGCNKYQEVLPDPNDIACALNNLKLEGRESNYQLFSQTAAGSIYGITSVLNQYWQNPNTEFPSPSMFGSGDRVSICWAIFGKAPDLSLGIEKVKSGQMYHACQGLSYTGEETQSCASKAVYHSCKGSNQCKGQGGCGFVHSVSGGGNCSNSGNTSADSGLYTAPGNNFCGGFGGCAVPMSAAQLYPCSGEMQVYKFTGSDCTSDPVDGHIEFKEGDSVYQIAWKAYCKSLEASGKSSPSSPPAVSDLRLAFPPST
ncbi:hypothetical protein H0A36_14135 [Endozoicomonas sp. SM1973]|uniref:Iminophenyl-pyruvate dimer synthase domain-containing protein n=1 Tax=Spartinivicinus marinus TaxID=2994442 RepID=A0A853IHU1_9GAMM|nr:ferritin-like domain-containing protein [Spartinivicinus marinus]MCX4028581.1 ferritin-like domain-containing protein [Spartinivicinus marinus]NYZ67156.1 hypothetical protein [Spartinivicinus marinus]